MDCLMPSLKSHTVDNGSEECGVLSGDVRHGTGDSEVPSVQDEGTESHSNTITLNVPPVFTKKVRHCAILLDCFQVAVSTNLFFCSQSSQMFKQC